MKWNRGVTAALVAVALTWLVPVGAARAQTTVSMGRPGDHWASMLRYTSIRRDERNGVYGYEIKLRAEDGCEAELFYPRTTIDFHGNGRTWRNFKVRVKTGWLYYPSRLNASSLPNVHPTLLSLEESYQRLADGGIAAAQGFADVATLGTMTPLPRSVPTPRAPRTTTPRAPAPRTASPRNTAPRTAPAPRAAPARTKSAGMRSAVRGVLPRSGSIPRSLGAASRAEMIARRVGLNLESATSRQVLNSLDTPVTEFIARFRKASIRREFPGEFLREGVTVERALLEGGSRVRKLLTKREFIK